MPAQPAPSEPDLLTAAREGDQTAFGRLVEPHRREGLVSIDVSIRDPVPPQFFFRDTDGNRFLIVEPD